MDDVPGMATRAHRGASVRRLRDGRQTRYIVASLEDADNLVYGLGYHDRMRLVFAIDAVVSQVGNAGPEAEELRDAYITWVGLEVLLRVVARRRLVWGQGRLGDAYVPMRPRDNARTWAPRNNARKENLLLNQVEGLPLDPRFSHLDYPRELRRIKDELYEAFHARGAYIPAHALSLGVLEYLATTAQGDAEAWGGEAMGRRLASRCNFKVPGLDGSFNHATVAHILDYYGLGTPRHDGGQRGYYVRLWRVRALMELWQRDRFVHLRDVYWMKGRYLHDPGLEHGDASAARP